MKGPSEHLVPDSACLNCGHVCNGAGSFESDERPEEGNICVCIRCGHIMAFTADLMMRELTDEEVVEVAGNPEIVRITTAIHMMKQEQEREKANADKANNRPDPTLD